MAREANAGVTFELLLISAATESVTLLHGEDGEQSRGWSPVRGPRSLTGILTGVP